jgi:F-type H+-transporting ATPase subunit epsilon
MPDSNSIFPLVVLTPAGPVASADAVSAVVPAVDGEMGLLTRHSPVVAALGAGRLWFRDAQGNERTFFAAGGFAQVRTDGVTVLAEQCVPRESLDEAAVQAELDAAVAGQDLPPSRRAQVIAHARAKLRVAQAREDS